ncbi:MAG: hypothetical protein Q9181_006935 [Wetmoreana brouardii]
MASHTASQRYLSTRGGSYGLSFEEVVLKGLASDYGLFIPEEIPSLPPNWQLEWLNISFEELAFQIFSLYISAAEIPPASLKDIIYRSYSTFRVPSVTSTVTLDDDKRIHLLELFHGPTFSAAIYGLRSKKDVSVFIMYPSGKVSPVQEAQMTTVTDENVHCLSVDGTFDDCQDFVKALFADPLINKTQRLGAVNSINWARILAQITYYFASYFSLIRSGKFDPAIDQIRFVVPTGLKRNADPGFYLGNFGDILAGYFAKRMGLPVSNLIIATNENDILYRFWQTGAYEKHTTHGTAAEGGLVEDGVKAHPEGVKETLSPAMNILVSSNFERLLWFVAYDVYGSDAMNVIERRQEAGSKVKEWQTDLKTKGGFSVEEKVLNAAKAHFASERISDAETITTIRDVYRCLSTSDSKGYILDPHTAIGVAAALRSAKAAPDVHNVALATAHPAKFSHAVELALREDKGFQFKDVLPPQFVGLEDLPRRCTPMSGAETLGVVASATQLAAYSIKIVLQLDDLFTRLRNIPNRIKGHINQLRELIGTTTLIEQHECLQSPVIHAHLRSTLSEAQSLYHLLRELSAKYAGSSIWRYWVILRSVGEEKILTSLDNLEREKSSLRLCISLVHTDLLWSIQGSIDTLSSRDTLQQTDFHYTIMSSSISATQKVTDSTNSNTDTHTGKEMILADAKNPGQKAKSREEQPTASLMRLNSGNEMNLADAKNSGWEAENRQEEPTTSETSNSENNIRYPFSKYGHVYNGVHSHQTAMLNAGDVSGEGQKSIGKNHVYGEVSARDKSRLSAGNINNDAFRVMFEKK